MKMRSWALSHSDRHPPACIPQASRLGGLAEMLNPTTRSTSSAIVIQTWLVSASLVITRGPAGLRRGALALGGLRLTPLQAQASCLGWPRFLYTAC